eukprot:1663357-Amphidinium_carterae.1
MLTDYKSSCHSNESDTITHLMTNMCCSCLGCGRCIRGAFLGTMGTLAHVLLPHCILAWRADLPSHVQDGQVAWPPSPWRSSAQTSFLPKGIQETVQARL